MPGASSCHVLRRPRPRDARSRFRRRWARSTAASTLAQARVSAALQAATGGVAAACAGFCALAFFCFVVCFDLCSCFSRPGGVGFVREALTFADWLGLARAGLVRLPFRPTSLLSGCRRLRSGAVAALPVLRCGAGLFPPARSSCPGAVAFPRATPFPGTSTPRGATCPIRLPGLLTRAGFLAPGPAVDLGRAGDSDAACHAGGGDDGSGLERDATSEEPAPGGGGDARTGSDAGSDRGDTGPGGRYDRSTSRFPPCP